MMILIALLLALTFGGMTADVADLPDLQILEWSLEEGTRVPFKDIGNAMPGSVISKIVEVQNTGNVTAEVAVEVAVSVELSDGSSGDAFLISLDSDDRYWKAGDGRFYYKEPLAPGRITEPLFRTVTISPEAGNEYAGAHIVVRVRASGVAVEADTGVDASGKSGKGIAEENVYGGSGIGKSAYKMQKSAGKSPVTGDDGMKRAIVILYDMILFLFGLVLAVFLIAWLAGVTPRIVLTGSMEPSIPTGSLAWINTHYAMDKLEVGDVVAYTTDSGVDVTHRIVEIAGDKIVTRGDANEQCDRAVRDFKSAYIGKTVFHVPKLGFLFRRVQMII